MVLLKVLSFLLVYMMLNFIESLAQNSQFKIIFRQSTYRQSVRGLEIDLRNDTSFLMATLDHLYQWNGVVLKILHTQAKNNAASGISNFAQLDEDNIIFITKQARMGCVLKFNRLRQDITGVFGDCEMFDKNFCSSNIENVDSIELKQNAQFHQLKVLNGSAYFTNENTVYKLSDFDFHNVKLFKAAVLDSGIGGMIFLDDQLYVKTEPLVKGHRRTYIWRYQLTGTTDQWSLTERIMWSATKYLEFGDWTSPISSDRIGFIEPQNLDEFILPDEYLLTIRKFPSGTLLLKFVCGTTENCEIKVDSSMMYYNGSFYILESSDSNLILRSIPCELPASKEIPPTTTTKSATQTSTDNQHVDYSTTTWLIPTARTKSWYNMTATRVAETTVTSSATVTETRHSPTTRQLLKTTITTAQQLHKKTTTLTVETSMTHVAQKATTSNEILQRQMKDGKAIPFSQNADQIIQITIPIACALVLITIIIIIAIFFQRGRHQRHTAESLVEQPEGLELDLQENSVNDYESVKDYESVTGSDYESIGNDEANLNDVYALYVTAESVITDNRQEQPHLDNTQL